MSRELKDRDRTSSHRVATQALHRKEKTGETNVRGRSYPRQSLVCGNTWSLGWEPVQGQIFSNGHRRWRGQLVMKSKPELDSGASTSRCVSACDLPSLHPASQVEETDLWVKQ